MSDRTGRKKRIGSRRRASNQNQHMQTSEPDERDVTDTSLLQCQVPEEKAESFIKTSRPNHETQGPTSPECEGTRRKLGSSQQRQGGQQVKDFVPEQYNEYGEEVEKKMGNETCEETQLPPVHSAKDGVLTQGNQHDTTTVANCFLATTPAYSEIQRCHDINLSWQDVELSTTPEMTSAKNSLGENHVVQATFSVATEDKQHINKHLNLDEVSGSPQSKEVICEVPEEEVKPSEMLEVDNSSEDAANDEHDQEIKATKMQETHEIDNSSESVIPDAAEYSAICFEKLMVQAEIRDIHQSELSMKSIDDSASKLGVSDPDVMQEEHPVKENMEALDQRNEDYYPCNTEEQWISNIERPDTVSHQVYKGECQNVIDRKPSAEGFLLRAAESQSSLQIVQSEIKASLDSHSENKHVSSDEQMETSFNAIGNRRKLGSSRRNRGRRHVKSTDAESYHESTEKIDGNTTDHLSETAVQEQSVETVPKKMEQVEASQMEEVCDESTEDIFGNIRNHNLPEILKMSFPAVQEHSLDTVLEEMDQVEASHIEEVCDESTEDIGGNTKDHNTLEMTKMPFPTETEVQEQSVETVQKEMEQVEASHPEEICDESPEDNAGNIRDHNLSEISKMSFLAETEVQEQSVETMLEEMDQVEASQMEEVCDESTEDIFGNIRDRNLPEILKMSFPAEPVVQGQSLDTVLEEIEQVEASHPEEICDKSPEDNAGNIRDHNLSEISKMSFPTETEVQEQSVETMLEEMDHVEVSHPEEVHDESPEDIGGNIRDLNLSEILKLSFPTETEVQEQSVETMLEEMDQVEASQMEEVCDESTEDIFGNIRDRNLSEISKMSFPTETAVQEQSVETMQKEIEHVETSHPEEIGGNIRDHNLSEISKMSFPTETAVQEQSVETVQKEIEHVEASRPEEICDESPEDIGGNIRDHNLSEISKMTFPTETEVQEQSVETMLEEMDQVEASQMEDVCDESTEDIFGNIRDHNLPEILKMSFPAETVVQEQVLDTVLEEMDQVAASHMEEVCDESAEDIGGNIRDHNLSEISKMSFPTETEVQEQSVETVQTEMDQVEVSHTEEVHDESPEDIGGNIRDHNLSEILKLSFPTETEVQKQWLDTVLEEMDQVEASHMEEVCDAATEDIGGNIRDHNLTEILKMSFPTETEVQEQSMETVLEEMDQVEASQMEEVCDEFTEDIFGNIRDCNLSEISKMSFPTETEVQEQSVETMLEEMDQVEASHMEELCDESTEDIGGNIRDHNLSEILKLSFPTETAVQKQCLDTVLEEMDQVEASHMEEVCDEATEDIGGNIRDHNLTEILKMSFPTETEVQEQSMETVLEEMDQVEASQMEEVCDESTEDIFGNIRDCNLSEISKMSFPTETEVQEQSVETMLEEMDQVEASHMEELCNESTEDIGGNIRDHNLSEILKLSFPTETAVQEQSVETVQKEIEHVEASHPEEICDESPEDIGGNIRDHNLSEISKMSFPTETEVQEQSVETMLEEMDQVEASQVEEVCDESTEDIGGNIRDHNLPEILKMSFPTETEVQEQSVEAMLQEMDQVETSHMEEVSDKVKESQYVGFSKFSISNLLLGSTVEQHIIDQSNSLEMQNEEHLIFNSVKENENKERPDDKDLIDRKPSAEGFVWRASENQSSLQIVQSEIKASLDSHSENKHVSSEEQMETSFHSFGSRKKLGSSRRNRGRRHVKDADTESCHESTDNNAGNTSDHNTPGMTKVAFPTETAVQEQSVETLQKEMDRAEASHTEEICDESTEGIAGSTKDHNLSEISKMSFPTEPAVQEQNVETLQEEMDQVEASHTEEVSDKVKESEYVGISESTISHLHSDLTIDQHIIDQPNSLEMPNEEHLSVNSVTEKENKERHEDEDLFNQHGHLQLDEEATFPSTKTEERSEHFNLSEIKDPEILEDAVNDEHDQEIKATQMQEKHEIYSSSGSVISDAVEDSPTCFEKLMAGAEIRDTPQSELSMKSIDDSASKLGVSDSDVTREEHPVKERNEDYHPCNTEEPGISSIERPDFVSHKAYEGECQDVIDRKPSAEGFVWRAAENQSSLQIVQSEIKASLDSHSENKHVSSEEQMGTSFRSIGNRRKLGSSRRNRGRRHVKDADTESCHESTDNNAGNTRDHNTPEMTKVSFPTETAVQEQSVLEGMNQLEFTSSNIHSNIDQQIICQSNSKEMPSEQLPIVYSETVTENMERGEDEGLISQHGTLQDNYLAIHPLVKTEYVESSSTPDITTEKNSLRGNTETEDIVQEATMSSFPEGKQSTERKSEHFNIFEVRDAQHSNEHLNEVLEHEIKATEIHEIHQTDYCPVKESRPSSQMLHSEVQAPLDSQPVAHVKEKSQTGSSPSGNRRKLGSSRRNKRHVHNSDADSNEEPTEGGDHRFKLKDGGEDSDFNTEADSRNMGVMEEVALIVAREVLQTGNAEPSPSAAQEEEQKMKEVSTVQDQKLRGTTPALHSLESRGISETDEIQACLPQQSPCLSEEVKIFQGSDVKDTQGDLDIILETSQPCYFTTPEVHKSHSFSALSSDTQSAVNTESGVTKSFYGVTHCTSTHTDDKRPQDINIAQGQGANGQEALKQTADASCVADLVIVTSGGNGDIIRGEEEETGEVHWDAQTNIQQPKNVTNFEMEDANPHLNLPIRRRKMGSTRWNLRPASKGEDLHQKPELDNEATDAATNVADVVSCHAEEEHRPRTEPKDSDPGSGNYSSSGIGRVKVLVHQTDEESPVSGQLVESKHHDVLVKTTTSPNDPTSETASGGRRRKMGSNRKTGGQQTHSEQQNEDRIIDTEAGRAVKTHGSAIETLEEHRVQDQDKETQVDESCRRPSSNISGSETGDHPGPARSKAPQQVAAPKHVDVIPHQDNLFLAGTPNNSYNVVMVGDSGVGKTCFMRRAHSGKFSLDLPASVGLDTCLWTVVVDGKPVVLQLWDTAGQERFHSITKQIFHKAQAFLLMYDITSSMSFSSVRYWATCIQEGAVENVPILLLGNKSDHAERQVQTEEGKILAKDYNIDFMECSSATGENVIQSLETVARLLSNKAERKEESLMLRKEPEKRKTSGCC